MVEAQSQTDIIVMEGFGGTLIGANGSKGGSGSGYTVATGGTQISGGIAGKGTSGGSSVNGGFGFGGSGRSAHGGGGRWRILWWRPEDTIIHQL